MFAPPTVAFQSNFLSRSFMVPSQHIRTGQVQPGGHQAGAATGHGPSRVERPRVQEEEDGNFPFVFQLPTVSRPG